MSSINVISPDKLARLIGTPHRPTLLDLRSDEEFAADPSLIPGSNRSDSGLPLDRLVSSASGAAIVLCRTGGALSHGVAAQLRAAGLSAEVLDGGFAAWSKAGLPLVSTAKLPPRTVDGRTVWVTRERPKVDRIACPWLIRRFVDPNALFLFVAPAEVVAVADRFGAAAFDIEGVFWSHRGDFCTFDVMVEEFDLRTAPLQTLATIVRAADTARLDLAPQAAGLLAASLGLSRMHADDQAQLEAGMTLYDAFYRWCRDATAETHNWPTNKAGATR